MDNSVKELNAAEIQCVNGGVAPIVNFAVGYVASKLIDNYYDWVTNGAGGWREPYTGQSYNDPLL